MKVVLSVVQDSFCQILYMYLSEGVPVQSAHSGTGCTGLMAAAHHGLAETATQILQIGNSLPLGTPPRLLAWL